jgi:predicted ArsR family transcriptional regulator
MNPDALFNAFKKKYFNSDNFTKSGDEITLILKECTCPMVKNGVTDPFLCNCTIGYSKKLFETLFKREVEVELKQSILRGDAICKQIIII